MPSEPEQAGHLPVPQHHPPHDGAPRKLSLVVYSGAFSRVHYALVMASAAAAVGTPATLFFTMDAARYLQKPCADGTPGWRALPVSPSEPATLQSALAHSRLTKGGLVEGGLAEGGLAAEHAAGAAGAVDDDYRKRGVASFEELLLACAAFGVSFMVCEMGLRVIGLDASALRADLAIRQGGIVSFLADASQHGAMLFI